jgi:hypothetical protein
MFRKYLDMCLAFLKQLWSSIRNVLPVVSWPSRVGSSVPLAPQKTGAPAASASSDAAVPDTALVQTIAHLEYLGYETRPAAPDGWCLAVHPHRYNFHLCTYARGVRLHCTVSLGPAFGNSRVAWLEFLNTANERGLITQFSLFEDKAGNHGVRMFAFVSGAYNRAAFAMAMDMWHDDLDLVRRKPELFRQSAADEDEEDVERAIVNRTCH